HQPRLIRNRNQRPPDDGFTHAPDPLQHSPAPCGRGEGGGVCARQRVKESARRVLPTLPALGNAQAPNAAAEPPNPASEAPPTPKTPQGHVIEISGRFVNAWVCFAESHISEPHPPPAGAPAMPAQPPAIETVGLIGLGY